MIATDFPESNAVIERPPELTEQQCSALRGFVGKAPPGSSVAGLPVVIVAWQPTEAQLAELQSGAPVFITFLGANVAPHLLRTNFRAALEIP